MQQIENTSTREEIKEKVEKKILASLTRYTDKTDKELTLRIQKIEREWSFERAFAMIASFISLVAISLTLFMDVNLLLVSIPFLLLWFIFALFGKSPTLFFRSRREIEIERLSLKFYRGDFNKMNIKNLEQIYDRMKRVI